MSGSRLLKALVVMSCQYVTEPLITYSSVVFQIWTRSGFCFLKEIKQIDEPDLGPVFAACGISQ